MARKRDRIIAGFFAGLFLLTSSALTIMIVWQTVQDNKAKNAQKELLKTEKKVDNTNKLEGKQLENFTPIASIPELQKVDSKAGTGKEVKAGDTVTVNYTGAVASTGKIFQSSLDSGQPVSFPLNGVIAGWSQGIPGMKEGGTRRLLIPSALAYGSSPPPSSGIPANADLVFDVTLIKIGK
ncbi:MAG: FKBP-type peptidyl-prolyl cis-trans isomerase [bacterium]|jgi:FKBP-type peptidyl-prolyl cis-trans isomerase